MPTVSAAEAPTFDLNGTIFTGLAAPSRGSRENAVWRVMLPAGTTGVPHRLTREEILVVLTGKAVATIAGATREVTAGGAIIVPANTDFSLANPGDQPFEALAILPVGGQAVLADAAPFTPPWAV